MYIQCHRLLSSINSKFFEIIFSSIRFGLFLLLFLPLGIEIWSHFIHVNWGIKWTHESIDSFRFEQIVFGCVNFEISFTGFKQSQMINHMTGNRSCLLPINLKCFATEYFNIWSECFPHFDCANCMQSTFHSQKQIHTRTPGIIHSNQWSSPSQWQLW